MWLGKEAVLRQILQHLLTIHSKDEDDQVLLLAEEQLETLQALLEEEAPLVDRPPLPRSRAHSNATPGEIDHAAEPSTINGREAIAMSSPSLNVDRQDRVTGAGENEDARHVVQFMRRHEPGESLRIASSVLYATVGVIETQGGRTNETSLVRAIAGEIHSVARHLLHQRQLEDEGDQLQRGTKRLSAAEVVQWKRHLADNEQEEEETAMTMMETGGEEPSEEGSQDSTPIPIDAAVSFLLTITTSLGKMAEGQTMKIVSWRWGDMIPTPPVRRKSHPLMTQLEHRRGKKMRMEQQRKRKMWKQPRGRKTRTWMMSCGIDSSRGMHYRIQRLPQPWGGTTMWSSSTSRRGYNGN